MKQKTSDYYNNTLESYINNDNEVDFLYHQTRFQTARELLLSSLSGEDNVIFDFGCGSGEFFNLFPDKNFTFYGCDISTKLLDEAIKNSNNIDKDSIMLGSLECLDKFTNKFDAIVSLNVLPYLSDDESATFFKLSHTALKDGALLHVSHTNSLFDLVTFNRYTVEFFKENFLNTLSISHDHKERLILGLEDMITYHDYPTKNTEDLPGDIAKESMSERDVLKKYRKDPFTYDAEVESYGFVHLETRCINCYPFPPKIIQNDKDLVKLQHKFHSHIKSETLRKIFCSQYQMIFKKV